MPLLSTTFIENYLFLFLHKFATVINYVFNIHIYFFFPL